MNCEYCQSPAHIWFQCPKKPDGWKPARLAKKSAAARTGRAMHTLTKQEGNSSGIMLPTELEHLSTALPVRSSRNIGPLANEPAGTQALPVDTNAPASASKSRARQPRAETGHNLSETKVASDDGISGRVGGALKYDKKAWMREYMREYMRKRRSNKAK